MTPKDVFWKSVCARWGRLLWAKLCYCSATLFTQAHRIMTTSPSERTITVHWEDPRKLGEAARGLTGMEFLQKIAAGELPPPPIAALLNFELVELSEGR